MTTTGYDEAIDFFTRVIGFTLVEDTPLENGKRWVIVAPPDGRTSLLLARALTPRQEQTVGNQTGGRVAFFLHTDEFPRAYDTLRGRGVEFVEEPRHESSGTVAVFADLYGNRWDLVEPGSRTPASVVR